MVKFLRGMGFYPMKDDPDGFLAVIAGDPYALTYMACVEKSPYTGGDTIAVYFYSLRRGKVPSTRTELAEFAVRWTKKWRIVHEQWPPQILSLVNLD